jgi:DNA-directed RNA polymerase specialized sigma24 family protein
LADDDDDDETEFIEKDPTQRDVHSQVVDRYVLALVDEFLENRPYDDLLLFKGHVFEGASYEELSRITRKSATNLRVRMFRLKAEFKQFLRKKDPDILEEWGWGKESN